MIALSDILAAQRRIRAHMRPTPLIESAFLSEQLGRPVLMKPECLQVTRSFKARGALNAMQLMPGAHFVTASAGNHGRGAAFAARILERELTVFVPASAPRVKQEAIARLGARLVRVAGGYDLAHEKALQAAAETGATYLPAYEHDAVIAGQGTIGLEMLEERPDLAALVVPVGGGGLIAGVASAATAIRPSCPVLGVQSEATPAMHRSLGKGAPQPVDDLPTLCDGLAGGIDAHTLHYCQERVRRVLLVSEQDVATAIRALFTHENLIVEGSGSVGVAGLMSGALDAELAALPADAPIGVVLSGGNIDPEVLLPILTAGS